MVVPVLEFKHVRTDSAAFRKNREQYAMKPVQVRLLSSGHKVSNMDFGLNFYQVEAAGSGFVPANYMMCTLRMPMIMPSVTFSAS